VSRTPETPVSGYERVLAVLSLTITELRGNRDESERPDFCFVEPFWNLHNPGRRVIR
jgi:hypothetical protein